MKTQIELKVRGFHIDIFGHVNHARYLEFLEEGRWDYLDKQSDFYSFIQKNLNFIIVNINISYRKPAKIGDKLLITSCLNKMGNSSGVIRQEVTSIDQKLLYADAEVTFVLLDETGKIKPIKGELKTLMEKLINN